MYLYISYIGTALAVSFPSCNSNYPGRSYFNNPWRSQLLHSWSIRYALNDSFPRMVAWENTLKDKNKHGWHPKPVPGTDKRLKFIGYWPQSDSILTSSICDYLARRPSWFQWHSGPWRPPSLFRQDTEEIICGFFVKRSVGCYMQLLFTVNIIYVNRDCIYTPIIWELGLNIIPFLTFLRGFE